MTQWQPNSMSISSACSKNTKPVQRSQLLKGQGLYLDALHPCRATKVEKTNCLQSWMINNPWTSLPQTDQVQKSNCGVKTLHWPGQQWQGSALLNNIRRTCRRTRQSEPGHGSASDLNALSSSYWASHQPQFQCLSLSLFSSLHGKLKNTGNKGRFS